MERLRIVTNVVNKLQEDRKMTITVSDCDTENPQAFYLLYRTGLMKIEAIFDRLKQVQHNNISNPDNNDEISSAGFSPFLCS